MIPLRLVSKLTGLELIVEPVDPPNLVITAKGLASGWVSDARLVLCGIAEDRSHYTYELRAVHWRSATDVPVSATDVVAELRVVHARITVRAETNELSQVIDLERR